MHPRHRFPDQAEGLFLWLFVTLRHENDVTSRDISAKLSYKSKRQSHKTTKTMYMKTIITILLALIAAAGQGQTTVTGLNADERNKPCLC